MKRSTVIVIGAGASKPYGLPLGWELRDKVIELARRDSFSRLCEELGHQRRHYQQFATALSKSGERSVDAFLERAPEWTKLGKLGIAYCLTCLEQPLKWFPPHQPKGDHWLESLWGLIRQDTWLKQRALPITVVTFNYDRIIEHYLATVMGSAFEVSQKAVNKYISEKLVVHVHGSLGNYTDLTFGFPFPNGQDAVGGALGIKIIHEQEGVTPDFVRAQKALRSAERVLFLGFGYHRKNMARLDVRSLREEDQSKIVLGTHKGIKAAPWQKICVTYKFSESAMRLGAGTISDFLYETMNS